jgi:hypothetical protein
LLVGKEENKKGKRKKKKKKGSLCKTSYPLV